MSATSQVIKANYGSSAMYIGSAVGGAVVATVAQSKIKFLDTMLGKLLLIVLGILMVAKAKSETVKGLGTGIAVGGSLGFVKSIAGSFSGFEGLAGFDGDGGGMGQVVTDENGMIYMVNGVGELIPLEGDPDYTAMAGLGGEANEYI